MIEMVYVPKENNEKDVRIFGEDFVYNNSDNIAHFYDSWESFYNGFIGDHSIKILVNFKSGGSGSVPWIVIRVLE